MRVWGRVPTSTNENNDGRDVDEFGKSHWVLVETDARGFDDYVHATALVQCLKLNLGESPFYGNFGIPARASVRQQIAPDFAVAFTQSVYAKYFASLAITKVATSYPATPTYNVSVVRKDGSLFQQQVGL